MIARSLRSGLIYHGHNIVLLDSGVTFSRTSGDGNEEAS